jgi:hypothetical protein
MKSVRKQVWRKHIIEYEKSFYVSDQIVFASVRRQMNAIELKYITFDFIHGKIVEAEFNF